MSEVNTQNPQNILSINQDKDSKILKVLSNAIDGAMQNESFKAIEVDGGKEYYQNNRLKYLIDVREDIPPPQKAWGLKGENGEVAILGTLGNFSLIIGKAKAKKSFFVNIAISCTLAKDGILNRFISDLPPTQRKVLYFDTEQGKHHVQLAVKRICKQLGVEVPTNLSTFHLRGLNPAERLKFIEEAIYNEPEVGFVVIDGIKDLVTSINDESEATMIASKLLKWTEEMNIHVITVLHQNKGDNNARGHIGTELQNKAETVLSVTVDESNSLISTVKPEMCRNREPETFSFEINEDGLPVEVIGFEPNIRKKKSFNINDIENFKVIQLLNEVYSHGTEFNYTNLEKQLKIACKKQLGQELGNNKIQGLITRCRNEGLISQERKNKPYFLTSVRDEDIF